MISQWQESNNFVPTTKKGVRDQIVSNNRITKNNKASVYFRSWYEAGICKLSSLLDESHTRFLSFKEFLRKFNVKCNFLQYHGLLSAIASVWKKYLKQDEQAATVNLLAVDKLTCKKIYRSLIDHQNFSPPTAEKRLIECGFDIHERQKIYSLPFLVTKQIKLSIFQYNIIHNFLYTNTLGARGFFFSQISIGASPLTIAASLRGKKNPGPRLLHQLHFVQNEKG